MRAAVMDVDQALLDFVGIFDELALPYAIMGGIAARAHGIPRPTRDVDVTLSIDDSQLPQLFNAAEQRGYTVPDTYKSGWVDRVAGMPMVKFRVHFTGGSVDVDLFLVGSPFQEEIIKRRRIEHTELGPMALVTPEDLILLKLIAARPRDFIDVADVLFMQGHLDETYMRLWADRLGIRESLEEAFANHPGDARP